MSYLNYEFLDEFRSLDCICRDIYGDSDDNKLGVTLYLENMYSNAYVGSCYVTNWNYDFNYLKSLRNLRNELVHSRNSMMIDICTEDDIEFIRSFKQRILNQTDPVALLRKQLTGSCENNESSDYSPFIPKNNNSSDYQLLLPLLDFLVLFLIALIIFYFVLI